MKRLFVASTELEIRSIHDHLPLQKTAYGFSVLDQGVDAGFIISGIGIPSTLIELSRCLTDLEPEEVIQIGFAGSFDNRLDLGGVFEVNEECFGDLGMDDHGRFLPLFQEFPGVKGSYGWISYPGYTPLPRKRGVTVNTATGSSERYALLKAHWNPELETMEGAAGMLFCQEMGVRYMQIRSVSNYVGPRNKSQWNTRLAGDNLAQWVITYLRSK